MSTLKNKLKPEWRSLLSASDVTPWHKWERSDLPLIACHEKLNSTLFLSKLLRTPAIESVTLSQPLVCTLAC